MGYHYLHEAQRDMESVSAAAQEQSAAAEEIASASEALSQLAHSLQNAVGEFKV